MQAILAQTIPALPKPAFLPRLLLEEPMLLTGVFTVAAVVAFYVYNSRSKVRKAVVWGGAGLLLAAGVQVLAFSVETDRERIIAATTPLVKATAAADTSRLDAMFDPGILLTNERGLGAGGQLPHGETWNKGQILDLVRKFIGNEWRLKECAVLEISGVIDGPGRGRTQVRVRATPEVTEFPMLSWWRIDWVQNSKGEWRVIGIQPIDLGAGPRLR